MYRYLVYLIRPVASVILAGAAFFVVLALCPENPSSSTNTFACFSHILIAFFLAAPVGFLVGMYVGNVIIKRFFSQKSIPLPQDSTQVDVIGGVLGTIIGVMVGAFVATKTIPLFGSEFIFVFILLTMPVLFMYIGLHWRNFIRKN